MMEMAQDNWTVDGFTFENQEDARLAKAELGRIGQLEDKIDHRNPHLVRAVYEKAIENKIFKTPVGLVYLKKLQEEVKKNPLTEKNVSDIPVVNIYTKEKVEKEVKQKVEKSVQKKELITKRASLFANVVLVILVALMFYIATTSNNPNIINYEYNLQNKYATWNEELTNREAVIRQKELELKILQED